MGSKERIECEARRKRRKKEVREREEGERRVEKERRIIHIRVGSKNK